MQHLAEVLRGAVPGGADIVALAEVENEHALETLNETYLKGLGYRAYAAEGGRTAVEVGLLTRLPVSGLRMHRISTGSGEPLRDIMEAHLSWQGKSLVLFLNHWKSKLGGSEATEAVRRSAASVVVRRLRSLGVEEPSGAVVVAGDLNESWDEYARSGGRYATALLPEEAAAGAPPEALVVTGDPAAARRTTDRVVLYSPWAEGGFRGSYAYGGGWETIDHTLLGPRLFDGRGIEYHSFAVVESEFLLDNAGRPLGFDPRSSAGYSDHLPILLTLEAAR